MIEVQVPPHVWTEQEAYSSGRTACRIDVLRSNNPFKGSLADQWEAGYQYEISHIPYSLKRVEYVEDRPEDNRSRSNHRRFATIKNKNEVRLRRPTYGS